MRGQREGFHFNKHFFDLRLKNYKLKRGRISALISQHKKIQNQVQIKNGSFFIEDELKTPKLGPALLEETMRTNFSENRFFSLYELSYNISVDLLLREAARTVSMRAEVVLYIYFMIFMDLLC